MPLVNVMVNGRAYTIACDDGEEDHLRTLAATVDAKAREVLSSVGLVGDTRLLLMAALLMADEYHAAVTKLESHRQGGERPQQQPRRAGKPGAGCRSQSRQCAGTRRKTGGRHCGAAGGSLD